MPGDDEGGTSFQRTDVLGNFRLALDYANGSKFPHPGDFLSGTFGEFFAAIDSWDRWCMERHQRTCFGGSAASRRGTLGVCAGALSSTGRAYQTKDSGGPRTLGVWFISSGPRKCR